MIVFVFFLFSPRSSEVDSDRTTETKKKKKKKRRRDSDSSEQHSRKNRSSEERESRKRRHHDNDKDAKHDNGYSSEKRRRTDHVDGSGDHLAPSNHTSPTNGSTHRHLNGYAGTTGVPHSKRTKMLK